MRILKDGIDITNDGNFTVEISDDEVREMMSTYKHINDLKFILCGSPFYNEIFNEIDKLGELKKKVSTYKKEVHNLNEALKKQQRDNSDAECLRKANESLEKAVNCHDYNIKMLSIEIIKRDTEIKELKEMLKEANSRCSECSLFKNSAFYKGE